jgi:putative acetyltransferase
MSLPNLIIRSAYDSDAQDLQRVFEAAVIIGCRAHYNELQLQAWISMAQQRRNWRDMVENDQVWVALCDGSMVGFIVLQDQGYIDMLFVHPEIQGRGIARQLYATAEQFALRRGDGRLHVQASISAQPFFTKQGFAVINDQLVQVFDQQLRNFVMEKYP